MKSVVWFIFVVGIVDICTSAAEPAWLAGKPMNQWFQINGTSGAGGAAVNAWGSLILREDTTELFIAASGGHSDSSDNRVVSIKLTDDNPQWILRAATTPIDKLVPNVPYYNDGLPVSRHNYQHNFWVPDINRIILCGARAVFSSAWDFLTVDGFNPDTNTWDPQNTWPNTTSGYGVARERNSSIIWTQGLGRLDLKSNSLTMPITTTANVQLRWPMTHDTRRHQLFSLQYGDGQGYNLDNGIQASRISLNPGTQQFRVTFKTSAAVDEFLSEVPTYAAMDYDPVNDRFLFFNGQVNAGRIYVITPNDGSEWDMSILPLTEGTSLPPLIPNSGINRRFLYVPGLNVFVMLPTAEHNIHFIRVGNFEQIPQSAPYVASPQSSNAPSQSTPSRPNNAPQTGSSDAIHSTGFTSLLLSMAIFALIY